MAIITYLKSSGYLIAEKILRIILGFFVGIKIAQMLGPHDYGRYSYILAWVSILSVISKLGLDNVILKIISTDSKVDDSMGTAILLRIFTSFIIIFSTSWLAYSFINDTELFKLIIILSTSLIPESLTIFLQYLYYEAKGKVISMIYIFQFIISIIVKVYLIIIGAEIDAFIYALLFDSVVLGGCLIFVFGGRSRVSLKNYQKSISLDLLSKGLPLMLSALAVVLYMKLDQFMINYFMGENALGVYSVSVKISESINFIPVIVTASVFPVLLNSRSESELKISSIRLHSMMFYLSLVLVGLLLTTSNFVIKYLGKDFSEAYDVLLLHCWSGIFVFWGLASTKWLVKKGLERFQLYRTASGLFVNLVLNIYLIPLFGLKGAALATIVSYSIAGLFFDIFFKQTRELFYIKINSINYKYLFSDDKPVS